MDESDTRRAQPCIPASELLLSEADLSISQTNPRGSHCVSRVNAFLLTFMNLQHADDINVYLVPKYVNERLGKNFLGVVLMYVCVEQVKSPISGSTDEDGDTHTDDHAGNLLHSTSKAHFTPTPQPMTSTALATASTLALPG